MLLDGLVGKLKPSSTTEERKTMWNVGYSAWPSKKEPWHYKGMQTNSIDSREVLCRQFTSHFTAS